MAREKYSSSKYMRAAESFGGYQKSIYEALSHEVAGQEKFTMAEEAETRRQKLYELGAETLGTAEHIKGEMETRGKTEKAVASLEELSGKQVDYEKVTLKDIIGGDASLFDYGEESFKFGEESFTRADMLAYGEKELTTKFDTMLGIDTALAKPEPKGKATGWKYGETRAQQVQRIGREQNPFLDESDESFWKEVDADMEGELKVKAGEERLAERQEKFKQDALKEEKQFAETKRRKDFKAARKQSKEDAKSARMLEKMNTRDARVKDKEEKQILREQTEEAKRINREKTKKEKKTIRKENKQAREMNRLAEKERKRSSDKPSMFDRIGDLLSRPEEERMTPEVLKDTGIIKDDGKVAGTDIPAITQVQDVPYKTERHDLPQKKSILWDQYDGDRMAMYLGQNRELDNTFAGGEYEYNLGVSAIDRQTGQKTFSLYGGDKNYGEMFTTTAEKMTKEDFTKRGESLYAALGKWEGWKDWFIDQTGEDIFRRDVTY
jgi:hypothetical protein|tara:strand:+ start:353 stop:1834 length:1482 start_codon:yes stop_codon:yes gene_type:complete